MAVFQISLQVPTQAAGTYELTTVVPRAVQTSGLRVGLATLFCQHTSASLIIMENADPSARADLQNWLNRLVPENDPHFSHTAEGPDDMPSHIKMALTRTSESIPFSEAKLLLGAWQGVFLWEHRRRPQTRQVLLTLIGE